ncbi:hypothetical protein Vadar_026393 [Vaccinium darrowii]|uniref:Uncharacterized protein n=1 Tax=Vaccinium darrowii TaxID=229202 RepID=A0ACB7YFX8_9ERIC|nr:hypothetical protein Vadar_026393 [Vaccinium darrowii]
MLQHKFYFHYSSDTSSTKEGTGLVSKEWWQCFDKASVSVEIKKQILGANEVYKLHNLPELCKDRCPHISIAWGMDDTSDLFESVVDKL